MTLTIDSSDNELYNKIKQLHRELGYCVFLDIVDSTKMKESTKDDWISYIYNTFVNAVAYFQPFNPLKSIGDELMFYITDQELKNKNYNPLQIFSWLVSIAKEDQKKFFKPVKIAAARCEEVYPITFMRNQKDYYGKDIDLTARLLSMASSQEIVIDNRFYQEIRRHYEGVGNKGHFKEVEDLKGPWPVLLKGIEQYTYVFKLPNLGKG